ncbi:MAG: aminotransferase class III-fold pyridoxal phosphate-dependent enzyme [Planctomycetota bacterium]
MGGTTQGFVPVRLSLSDMLGWPYVEAVCRAQAALTGSSLRTLMKQVSERVDFFPAALQRRLCRLLARTGRPVCRGLARTAAGASTVKFNAVTKTAMAPLAGLGYFRVGEDGRLHQTTKSEHYHAPLGHAFPGYRLLEIARMLGIPNATHNNTRGSITRLLEEALVRVANGRALGAADRQHGRRPAIPGLDRVLNLETGSLAVEAALKMVLARFYRPQADAPAASWEGRIPVIIVLGNDEGGLQANYHGTTLLTQTMRGMWDGLNARMEKGGAYKVVPVRPNNIADVRAAFARYDRGRYKVAAFFHEIVMMNYGGRVLTPSFLRQAYELCDAGGAATIDDEIQSCLWHHDLFMFKEWGLTPSFVAVGKGFPGGEYPASRIIFDARYDTLPQFGALVTNGQEEIASLAYLVTMAWAEANAEVTRALGDRFEDRLRAIAGRHPRVVASVDGRRHLGAIAFKDLEPARAFTAELNAAGIDISVQIYKTQVPPVALLKLPLIMDAAAIDALLDRMDKALRTAGRSRRKWHGTARPKPHRTPRGTSTT